MKKALILIGFISLFASCEKVDYSTYRISVYNTSSSEILLEYETMKEKGSIVLHNNIQEIGYYKTLLSEASSLDGKLPIYTKEEFEEKVLSVKISVISGIDTIPISKNFAPFENWEYWEHLDDQILEHDYRIVITDDMID